MGESLQSRLRQLEYELHPKPPLTAAEAEREAVLAADPIIGPLREQFEARKAVVVASGKYAAQIAEQARYPGRDPTDIVVLHDEELFRIAHKLCWREMVLDGHVPPDWRPPELPSTWPADGRVEA